MITKLAPTQINNCDLGIEEPQLPSSIVLYPNPAKATISLNFNQLVVSEIQIINSLGQYVKTINDDFETIPVADLPAGIYILRIDTEWGTINRKIIKE